MKTVNIFYLICTLLVFLLSIGSVFADNQASNGKAKANVNSLDITDMNLQSMLSGLKYAGGISGGYFYEPNQGEEASSSEFLLSNLLFEISSDNETIPIGFTMGFGQTSTPSVLDTPENTNALNIEYAFLALHSITDLSLEVGLLMPNSGFENTYTYDNSNVLLGAVASQQPYNAYGIKVQYDTNGISFWGGYYKQRLDDEEYNSPDETWEIGVSTSFFGNDFNMYHYHISGQRSLTGVSLERNLRGVKVGVNIDYWTWDSQMNGLFENDSSIGGALYVHPNFGNVSIPIRFEYIHHEESQIYVENEEVENITTATITPTYHFEENTYIRMEAVYVNADGAFEGKNGGSEDNRISLSTEIGFLF